MSEVRLYIHAGENDCALILDRLGAIFEDGEYAVTTMEIDEANNVW